MLRIYIKILNLCTFLVASVSDPGGVERVGEEAALVAVHGEALDAADEVCRADLFGAPQVDGLAGAGHSAEVHGVSVEGQSPVIKTLDCYRGVQIQILVSCD